MFWKSNDSKFEKLLKQHCQHAINAAEELKKILENQEMAEGCFQPIFEIEHKADEVVAEVHELLDLTFITKIDKLDIASLIHEMDEVVDCIKAIALRLHVYHLKTIRPEVVAFAEIIIDMTQGLKEILDNVLASRGNDKIKKHIIALKHREEEGDKLLHQSLEKLFKETDWKTVVQWKNILELLELATDHCDRVSSVMNSIARKESL